VYGHKKTLLLGGAWWILWSLVNGFCTGSLVTFALARAFCGIGAALVMPNVVAIIGITFPPGKMRNLTFGLFGFEHLLVAPLEVFSWVFSSNGLNGNGSSFAGQSSFLTSDIVLTSTSAILGVIFYAALWAVLPSEPMAERNGNVD